MSMARPPKDGSRRYFIWVEGHVDLSWSDWFGGMELWNQPNGTTVMVGDVADQAGLYGLLSQARDLGLSLRPTREASQRRRLSGWRTETGTRVYPVRPSASRNALAAARSASTSAARVASKAESV